MTKKYYIRFIRVLFCLMIVLCCSGPCFAYDPDDPESVLQALRENDPTLTELEFIRKRIGDNLAMAMFSALNGSAVTKIKLVNNRIGNIGLMSIANALEEIGSLTSFYFVDNEAGDFGVEAVAEVLEEDSSLIEFVFKSKKIHDGGVEAMARAVKENRSLLKFVLSWGTVGEDAFLRLFKAFAYNVFLLDIDIHGEIVKYTESRIDLKQLGSIKRLAVERNRLLAQLAPSLRGL